MQRWKLMTVAVHRFTRERQASRPVPARHKRKDANIWGPLTLSTLLRVVDVTEVYPPQRVVEVCHRYGLVKGDWFDLRTGFDLSDPTVQKAATQRIVETNAVLVILSPP